MPNLTTAYIGLGSNLGDRENFIGKALKMLSESERIQVSRVSDLIKTVPLGGAGQPEYLNAVAEIKTIFNAEDLHKRLINIENSLGRTRQEKWSPRTIDLDILLFGQEVINRPDLIIPHSQMHLRSFVLKGLCQLNAELSHPVIKVSVSELADRLGNMNFMFRLDMPQLVSIAGVIGVGKTTLAKKLSNLFGCKILLEPYDTNPFLAEVYAGKKELALDSQLYFLTNRAEQLDYNMLEKGKIYISDYIFDKDRIYAKRLLDNRQLASYEKIYPLFAAKVVSPVLVMYLRDSLQECLKRIHKRNRYYEQKIETQFLEDLDSDHEQLFAHWKTCPVIRISMSKLNYMEDANIDFLANQIRSYVAAQ